MKRIVVLATILLLYFDGFSQQRVEIAGSQVQKITSSIINQEYVLQVYLPAGYEKSTKKYPVVYLMDSQWDFPLMTAIYEQQYFDGFIPEMIIVGITWGDANPNPDSLRARDYTPTNEKRLPQSGGAATFLSVIKKEIIPFVESHYRANNDRTLMGCSLGGLFTLYALFADTQTFQRYVAATPAIGWDNEVIYRYEKEYFDKHAASPAKLYMTVGGVEKGVPDFEKLVKHLNSRNYKSLQIKASVLENTGHSGAKAETYTRGLQYVFERPSIKLSPAVLDRYTGVYRADNKKIEIKRVGDRLAIYDENGYRQMLHAASKADFYITSEFGNISFKQDKDRVTGFELIEYGGTQFVAKVR